MDIPISQRRVAYEMPGTETVVVRNDLEYANGLTMDLYAPPASDERMPAVVIVAGFPDDGFQKMVGCRFKEMQSTIDWARLIAASGMTAVLYTNRDPAADLHALLQVLPSRGIDATRVGAWASSGNVSQSRRVSVSESQSRRVSESQRVDATPLRL